MGGRMILAAVICFLAYWGWQYYKGAQKQKKSKEQDKYRDPSDFKDSDGDPDALEAYYKRKINEMEESSVKGAEDAQEKLEYYKQKLNKLNNLKK